MLAPPVARRGGSRRAHLPRRKGARSIRADRVIGVTLGVSADERRLPWWLRSGLETCALNTLGCLDISEVAPVRS